MPKEYENVPPISPELAKHLIPMCRALDCGKVAGHAGEHGHVPISMTPIERPVRKWTRNYLYGKSRVDDWPLWLSWLLAPDRSSRRIVRELMQIRKAGGDV